MKIAALLPNVEIYGGVRRYLEMGNALVRRGHEYILFTPAGKRPDWLEFRGRTMPFAALGAEEFDVGICGEYSILPHFDAPPGPGEVLLFRPRGPQDGKSGRPPELHFLGSSEGICRRIERKYGVRCLRAPGGINPDLFYPVARGVLQAGTAAFRFTILSYGRIYKKRKGVQHVIRAAEALHRKYPGVRLIFFDSLVGQDRRDPRPLIKTSVPYEFHLDLPQDRLAWLFSRADAFVSAERRAGWANTAAEAMACRLPVVCTASGSRDFAIDEETALVVPFAHPFFLRRQVERLILDPALRERLAAAGCEKIRGLTWDSPGRPPGRGVRGCPAKLNWPRLL